MNFHDYQQKALTTNLQQQDKMLELMQQVLGLGDETGEVLALFKKWIRDDGADPALLKKDVIKKELGDILWYIAVVAHDLGIDLEDIAATNIEKLASRKSRGTLRGSGDNR